MWIADNWKDYEAIDCSCGKAGALGPLYTAAPRPAGHMEYQKSRQALAKAKRALPSKRQRRRRMGILTCRSNELSATEHSPFI